MKPYKITLVAALLLYGTCASAQLVLYKSVIASAGSSYSSAGLSADWTVGQTVINQYTSAGLIITEGFHPVENKSGQPTTGVLAETKNIASVNAYPNPTGGILKIDVLQKQPAAITIEVMDAGGRIVKNIVSLPAQQATTMEIDMSELSPGVYLVMINAGTKDAYMMKVVKK